MADADPAFRARVFSALVLLPLAVGLVVAGGWGFALFVAFGVILMAIEWAQLTSARFGRGAGWGAGVAAVLFGLAAAFLAAFGAMAEAVAFLLLGSALAALAAWLRDEPALWIGLGVSYVGLPGLALIYLRSVPELGLSVLLWLLIVVWSTDTAAYFVGRRIGGPKLAPRISPGKTWSGLFGGMLGAAGASLLAAGVVGSTRLIHAAVAGAVLAAVAQAGDLVESALKRRAGVKDSGHLIPGHGGLLDRIDGLMFAAPALALAGALLGPLAWPWP